MSVTGDMTWTDLWAECTEQLGSSDEARHIVEQASGRVGASWLITMSSPAPLGASDRVGRMIQRRLSGEPLQYVLGRWGFRSLNLHVDKRVLIPRPETEQVVSAALKTLVGKQSPKVVDLGTGTGAIALSIAVEVPDAKVWATDISYDAIEVAMENLNELPSSVVERVELAQGSWFEALPEELAGKVDLLISNPPYVCETERADLDPVVREWEPEGALFSGEFGLDAIATILPRAADWLTDDGVFVVELAPQQAEAVRTGALELGFSSATVGTDLAGRKRWVLCSKVA